MKRAESTVLLCPHCLSPDLQVTGGIMGQKYRCKRCDYQGALILEMDADEAPPQD